MKKLGSAQVQLEFGVVQRAEPKLNPAHELVCRKPFFDFLSLLDRFRIFGVCLLEKWCKNSFKSCTFHF